MTHRRTPQEKKQDEYTKDHFAYSGSVHAFRKTWPRKKARANRAYRRIVNQVVDTLTFRQVEDTSDYKEPEAVRRAQVHKRYRVEPMGDVIKQRLDWRISSTAHHFFMYKYTSSRDRDHFIGFLSASVEGRTENSRRLAMHFKDVLSHSPEVDLPNYWHRRKQQWLKAFFQDEPEWEERLHTWIASFEQG